MESPRVVRLICALGIVGAATAAPAIARAQRTGAPDTPRPAAVGQVQDTVRAAKGARPANQSDLLTAKRAASKGARRAPSAAPAPTPPPQAPVKVKRRAP
jgi:hypothetical protein